MNKNEPGNETSALDVGQKIAGYLAHPHNLNRAAVARYIEKASSPKNRAPSWSIKPRWLVLLEKEFVYSTVIEHKRTCNGTAVEGKTLQSEI